MKAFLLLTIASSLLAGQAQAMDCSRGSNCKSSSMSGLASMFATTAIVPLSLISSQGLGNDIMAVQEDIVYALETGTQSKELQSVIARIRIELGDKVAGMTDEQILVQMLPEN